MGQLYVDTIEPQSGTALTVGESGQNTVLPGNDLRFNVIQDAGGNAIFTSNGSGTLSGVNSGFGSAWPLIRTETPSSVAAVDFGSTYITSTYDHYVVRYYYVRPATDNVYLSVNFSGDGGSSWMAKTTTLFQAMHNDANSVTQLDNETSRELHQGTAAQWLNTGVGNVSYENCVGELHLFIPTSTTFEQSFFSTSQERTANDYSRISYVSGTMQGIGTAINLVRFAFSSGNIAAGKFKLFGIK
jgi:hypothetical protein